MFSSFSNNAFYFLSADFYTLIYKYKTINLYKFFVFSCYDRTFMYINRLYHLLVNDLLHNYFISYKNLFKNRKVEKVSIATKRTSPL